MSIEPAAVARIHGLRSMHLVALSVEADFSDSDRDWWDRILQAVQALGAGYAGLPIVAHVDLRALVDLPDVHDLVNRQAVLTLTQTALLERPAHALRIIDQARLLGWRIGVSEVGRNPAALALLPLLDPDVIELDACLLHRSFGSRTAHVVASAGAKAERTGSLLFAAGVDIASHRTSALAAGATAGRGLLFTAPGENRARDSITWRPNPSRPPSRNQGPFRTAAAGLTTQVGSKRELIQISRRLELMAHGELDDVLLIGSFQHVRHFTMGVGERWGRIAQRSALVAALAQEMDPDPAPGVRGALLDRSDPLLKEWNLVVLTAQFAAVLSARDLGDHGPDLDRRFEFVVSYERPRVAAVAGNLMSRVPGEPRP